MKWKAHETKYNKKTTKTVEDEKILTQKRLTKVNDWLEIGTFKYEAYYIETILR